MAEKAVETIEEKLEKLIKKTEIAKINLSNLKSIKKNSKYFRVAIKYKILLVVFLISCLYIRFHHLFEEDQCYVSMPKDLAKVFRPPEKCSFCKGIKAAVRVANLAPEVFETEFAYSGKPVVITDATKNWTALQVFDFWYFKNLYQTKDPHRKSLKCQFFPYKTNFRNLFDALNMDKARVEYKQGTEPWYFGWSNCNHQIADYLRQHYDRPYFLHNTSALNPTDWIFMGGRGLGAHMHVDNVRLPSWQAQLKGTKEWVLAPPPECLYECNFFSIIVNPGDIIVLDTNKWYHQTFVLSDDISIVIGAEYD